MLIHCVQFVQTVLHVQSWQQVVSAALFVLLVVVYHFPDLITGVGDWFNNFFWPVEEVVPLRD